MEVVKSDVSRISPTHYGVAQFVHKLFKDQYKCHLVKKSPVWFEKQADETWKKIDDIVIRNRLSTDVVDGIALLRQQLRGTKDLPDLKSNNPSVETIIALNKVINDTLIERKVLETEGDIEGVRDIDFKINAAQDSILVLRKRIDLQRADMRDRMFSELAEAEGKMYNSPFKNGIMKELAGFFYEAIE